MARIWAVVASVLLAVLALATPASAQPSRQIECSSWQYRPASCPAGPGARGIAIARKIAGDCLPNRDWGLRGGAIYVANGCRAVFQIDAAGPGFGGVYPGIGNPGIGNPGFPGPGAQPGGQFARCESINYQPARCPMFTGGGVALRNVLGGSCQQGRSWGFDRAGVWVSNGCRADFIALNIIGGGNSGGYPGGGYPGGGNPGGGYPGGGYPGAPGAGYPGAGLIECSSWQYRPARCPVRTTRGVRIVSVIAGECIEGQTWGWDRAGIWVNGGCRARFRAF